MREDNITREELDSRREQVKRFRRDVSSQVINAYRDISHTIGNSSAIAYHTITGGQNAQYATPKGGMFTAINFTADVEKAVLETLDFYERRWYWDLLHTERDFLESQTQVELSVHERMGRTYVERELYPISGYLTS